MSTKNDVVSNRLNPESAAAVDLDLSRLLWVRCGVAAGAPSQPSVAKGFVLPEKYLVPPPVKKGRQRDGLPAIQQGTGLEFA
jgi:recombination protein RecA